jgi:GntR family transcriptional regulator, galactonate operon transcriptional repressor
MKQNAVTFERRPQSKSLSNQVVDIIGRKIASGELPVGETLPNEDQLAVELEVSRTVIREAVKILTDKGLVEVRPRIGTRVRPYNEWKLLDADVLRWQYESGPSREFLQNLITVRRSIEVTASEMAAEHATDDDLDYIKTCYAQLAGSVDDSGAYIEADLGFHESIYRACHNALLEQLAITLRGALKSSRKITVQIPGGSRDALPLHYAVLDAIVKHDVAAARTATHLLIDRSVHDIEIILNHGK